MMGIEITPQQARSAFYQAAANIEAKPELYNFKEIFVGDGDCPACMWGHVGRALGIGSKVYISDVALKLGFITPDCQSLGFTEAMYHEAFPHLESDDFLYRSDHAAMRLRAFADKHWPADYVTPVRPDLTECGQSFKDLMRSFGSEVAL